MNLIDGITATDSTKQDFALTGKDFSAGTPMLKARGLGTGDSIRIWEFVNGEWAMTAVVLDEDTTSRIVNGPGRYAVDAVLTTSGPVSVDLDSSAQ